MDYETKQILKKVKAEMDKAFKAFPNSYFDYSDSQELTHKRIIKCLDQYNIPKAKKQTIELHTILWYQTKKENRKVGQ